jgi:hypothetical protein
MLSLGEPWAARTPQTTIVCVGDAGGVDYRAVQRAFDDCVVSPAGVARVGLGQALSFVRSLGGYWGKPKART